MFRLLGIFSLIALLSAADGFSKSSSGHDSKWKSKTYSIKDAAQKISIAPPSEEEIKQGQGRRYVLEYKLDSDLIRAQAAQKTLKKDKLRPLTKGARSDELLDKANVRSVSLKLDFKGLAQGLRYRVEALDADEKIVSIQEGLNREGQPAKYTWETFPKNTSRLRITIEAPPQAQRTQNVEIQTTVSATAHSPGSAKSFSKAPHKKQDFGTGNCSLCQVAWQNTKWAEFQSTDALFQWSRPPADLVAGRVLDAWTNEPVTGASVKVSSSQLQQGTLTDGSFSFQPVNRASQKVNVTSPGYTENWAPIPDRSHLEERTQMVIYLQPELRDLNGRISQTDFLKYGFNIRKPEDIQSLQLNYTDPRTRQTVSVSIRPDGTFALKQFPLTVSELDLVDTNGAIAPVSKTRDEILQNPLVEIAVKPLLTSWKANFKYPDGRLYIGPLTVTTSDGSVHSLPSDAEGNIQIADLAAGELKINVPETTGADGVVYPASVIPVKIDPYKLNQSALIIQSKKYDFKISGRVIDLSTGLPAAGIKVTVPGLDISVVTDASGNYTIVGATSEPILKVVTDSPNIANDKIEIPIQRNSQNTYVDQQLSILPFQYARERVTIVLLWGQQPADLDSHLYIERGGANDHINYTETQSEAANLDVDDTDSFGPETTGILLQGPPEGGIARPRVPGVYHFQVFNFSRYGFRKEDTRVAKIKDAKAEVRIYFGMELLHKLHPPDQIGEIWDVAEIKLAPEGASKEDIKVINKMGLEEVRNKPVGSRNGGVIEKRKSPVKVE